MTETTASPARTTTQTHVRLLMRRACELTVPLRGEQFTGLCSAFQCWPTWRDRSIIRIFRATSGATLFEGSSGWALHQRNWIRVQTGGSSAEEANGHTNKSGKYTVPKLNCQCCKIQHHRCANQFTLAHCLAFLQSGRVLLQFSDTTAQLCR